MQKIIVGVDYLLIILVQIDLIQFSIDYAKTFLNWLRNNCAISITA